MLALVKTKAGPGSVELLEWPEPSPKPGWVVLEVAAAGICGTDLRIIEGNYHFFPPVVMGHEFSGTIVAIGDGVDYLKVGDRVVAEQNAGACGRCDLCRRGLTHLCVVKRPPGWGIDGAFARYLVVPATFVHLVPNVVPLEVAALCEPLAIVLTGLSRVRIGPGTTVAVIGPGSLGLLGALSARASGAERVIVVGRSSSKSRLATAEALGFEVALTDELLLDEATVGSSVDVVLETTGSKSAIACAAMLSRRNGDLVSLGLSESDDVVFPWNIGMQRGFTLHFSVSSNFASWNQALSLLAQIHSDVRELITVFELTDWESAFAAVRNRSVVKALIVRPGDASVGEASEVTLGVR